jgi:hypothetical protein
LIPRDPATRIVSARGFAGGEHRVAQE